MTSSMPTGIDVAERVIDLNALQADLETGGVAVPHGLTVTGPPAEAPVLPPPLPGMLSAFPSGALLFTYADDGKLADLPPEAQAIVDAYTP